MADADGVDAVLYDTGPVDENSPGILRNLIAILDAVSQLSERGRIGKGKFTKLIDWLNFR